MSTSSVKKHQLIILITGLFISGYCWRVYFDPNARAADPQNFNSAAKSLTIVEDGLRLGVVSQAQTVGDMLGEQHISFSQNDDVFPDPQAKLFSGSTVIVSHAKKITIVEGGNTNTVFTTQKTIEEAIWDQKNITLGDDDITAPARNLLVKDGMKIVVTHVLIKQETVEKPIAFNTVTNSDDTLSWRITKVTQKGIPGNNEITYKVVYNDGKEISRKILSQNVTQTPTDQIVTQGTYVKLGKASTGMASWYAYTGQLCAANPWLPLGSYVKVTNQDNGKSVIVKINDRGPFGVGRIIDLDKVAFAKIADLGAGVANIKMEVVTN